MKANVSQLNNCFGCAVCGSVCPKNIIRIEEIDGFLHPIIKDEDKCIECGICLNTCSFNSRDNLIFPKDLLHSYAARNTSKDVIKDSSSGGVSSALIVAALEHDMNVIAVKFNTQENKPEHYIITHLDEAKKARGSKYLQSDISRALNDINWEKKYLVIGTPCQVASFRQYLYLRHKEDNFIFVDFFCHGVPSYRLWRSYLKMHKIEPQNIRYVKFRTKDCGWQESTKIFIDAGDKIVKPDHKIKDVFFEWFLGDRCLANACYDSCKFKQINSYADIRIGDLWGIDFMNDKIGVSGIVTLTQRGEDFLSCCKNIIMDEVNPQIVLNGQMKRNAVRAKSYNIANWGLKNDLPLSLLNFMCSMIDEGYRIPKRILGKIKFTWQNSILNGRMI